jgi:ABC-type sulfate/molybdate transport systems ATPase subunit
VYRFGDRIVHMSDGQIERVEKAEADVVEMLAAG